MAENTEVILNRAEPDSKEPSAADLNDPSLYINRELSWLEFNHRVLEEAQDPNVPLLERLKFIAIFGSNLDEFFMVRVANLKQKIASGIKTSSGGDRMFPREQLDKVSSIVHELTDEAFGCLHRDILPELANSGIQILKRKELTDDERIYIETLFEREIFPVLTPLAVDPSHPFPRLLNKSLNLAIRLQRQKNSQTRLALVQVPAVLPRFLVIPGRQGHQVMPLEGVIRKYLSNLFPGMKIVDSYAFRVTRDSDLDLDDYEEIKDLIETIERQLRQRRRGAATRLEVEKSMPAELIDYLRDALDLEPNDVYPEEGPLDLTGFFNIYALPGYENLQFADFVPRALPAITDAPDLWTAIRGHDILLHHPYDSFKPVVDFISTAADDPNVLAIKQTLYRTSSNSPIITALQRAADRGKQVTALVELQARMDEEQNIAWSRELEKTGVHVVYGVVGLKTHCKVALVVRRDEDRIRRYVHMATGNYNPDTAKVYTDLGFLTCDEAFGEDASALFNYLTGFSELPSWKKLILAPTQLRPYLLQQIKREADFGKEGRIIFKINAILEPTVIHALYEASRAGVSIDLICRGICAIRPGIPGISENIRVISIVDRFLEHSRIYYFGNQGKPDVLLGSADLMDRNLIRRIEVLFPIEDKRIKTRIIQVLSISLSDNVKARHMQPDGTWKRLKRGDDVPPLRSQRYFLDMALEEEGKLTLEPPLESLPLIDPRLDSELLSILRHKAKAHKKKE